MFFFKKHQCKIAASFSHTWPFVCSTSGREGQYCPSHIWETGKQRLSTLDGHRETMRQSSERNQTAPKPPRLPRSRWGIWGNCCVFDLRGQNQFAVGRRLGIPWTQLFSLARTLLPWASLQCTQNLNEDLLPPGSCIIMWLWALTKAQVSLPSPFSVNRALSL